MKPIATVLANLRAIFITVTLVSCVLCAPVQSSPVSGKITPEKKGGKARADLGDVVAWLIPLSESAIQNTHTPPPVTARLVQKDKAFHPHLLVLPAGSAVEFPNRDPFFHNVFSLFNGKRFDLGLYEAGDSRIVHFDRVGVSYIFCNIHPEMSAIVIALNTPYHTVSDPAGNFSFKDVPPGEYELHVFLEGLSNDALRKLTRKVTIRSEPTVLAEVEIPDRSGALHHKNKYGQDYEKTSGEPYEH